MPSDSEYLLVRAGPRGVYSVLLALLVKSRTPGELLHPPSLLGCHGWSGSSIYM